MVVAAGSTSWRMKMSRSRLGSSKSSFRNLSTNVWQLKGESTESQMRGRITDPEQGGEVVQRKPGPWKFRDFRKKLGN